MKIYLIIAGFLIAGSAYASELSCINKVAKVEYSKQSPNDEADVPYFNSSLEIDKETLYLTSMLNSERKPTVDLATFSLVGLKKDLGVLTKNGQFTTKHFYQFALIASSSDPSDIKFDGMVYCTLKAYVTPRKL